jgi:hypothetical protein
MFRFHPHSFRQPQRRFATAARNARGAWMRGNSAALGTRVAMGENTDPDRRNPTASASQRSTSLPVPAMERGGVDMAMRAREASLATRFSTC